MCKKELFERILNLVIIESEVGEGILQNSKIKTREVVDARYLLIHFLHDNDYAGFDAAYIARALEMTPQGVRQIISGFDERKEQSGKIFEITYKRIQNALERK